MCACEHGHLNIAKRLLLEPHCDASIEDSVSYIQVSHVTFSRRFLSQSYLSYWEEAFFNRWPFWIISKLVKPLTGSPWHLLQSFVSLLLLMVLCGLVRLFNELFLRLMTNVLLVIYLYIDICCYFITGGKHCPFHCHAEELQGLSSVNIRKCKLWPCWETSEGT